MNIKSRTPVISAVSIITLIAMVTLNSCASLRPAAAVDLTGTWRAEVETPQGNFEVLITLSKSAAGAYTATVDVPVLGAYNVPLLFSFENNVVHYEDDSGFSFDGKLTDPSTIEGSATAPDGSTSSLVYKRME